MAHQHRVYDTDARFTIDAHSREIKNAASKKITVVQYDHKSERFTFELPRYIEGHDMSECNKVEVHYINIDSTTKAKVTGLYEVDDLQVNPENEEKVICSWLIDGNATQYAGQLAFLVRYCCLTDTVVDYAWNTAIFSDVYVTTGLNASETIVVEYIDILERWKESLFNAGYINADQMQKDIANLAVSLATEKGRIDLLSTYVTPEMFGAIGDGVADDSEAIQNAINSCSMFDTLRFHSKTYCVSNSIVLNKKINIDGAGATLKAIKEMDCVLHLTNQGALFPYTILQLKVDANSLATDAIRVGDKNHATQVTFKECVVRNAVQHGFHVLPVAYIINFVSCLANNNGADGLHAVPPDSSNQINAINVEKCSFQRNGESGLSVNGVSISITECNSEFNKYGITVGGSDYITYGAFITNCHLEYNTIASVYVDTKGEATVSVVRCYLMQSNYDEAAGATSFIKCSAAPIDITLIVEENTFQGNSALNYVDGGSKLGRMSRIVVGNIEQLVNMKLARIETVDTAERFMPIPVSLSSGAGFADCNTSVNLVSAEKKSIKMVIPYNLVNALLRLIGVYATTNGTTATLRCVAKVYNVGDGAVLFQTLYDATLTKTGQYTFNLLNNWGYRRIPNNAFVELEFSLTASGNASSVVLSRPYITAYV